MGYYNKQDNNTKVSFNGGEVYFSYKTPIAFFTKKTGIVVRENSWSNTTGKHLNFIDSQYNKTKADRVSSEDFEKQLKAAKMDGVAVN